MYFHVYLLLDFCITHRNTSVLCQSECTCLHKVVNMVVFFVKSIRNTYPKGRALMQMYRVVPQSKRRNKCNQGVKFIRHWNILYITLNDILSKLLYFIGPLFEWPFGQKMSLFLPKARCTVLHVLYYFILYRIICILYQVFVDVVYFY